MSKKQKTSKKRFLNSKQGILFLVFAAVIWTLSALSNTYNTTVPVQVELISDSEIFIPLSSSFQVPAQVSSSGFSILYRRFFPRKIELVVSKLPIKDFENPMISSTFLYEAYVAKFSSANRITSFGYGTVDLPITLASKKSYAPSISYLPLANGYQLMAPLKFSVDSVSAFGSKKTLSRLNKVVFELDFQEELKSNFTLQAKLVDSIAKMAYWSSNVIEVSGIVDRYSDVTYSLPLILVNVPESVALTLTPNQVKVKFAVPLSRLKSFDVSALRAEVDFEKSESGQLPVNILGLSTEMKQVSVSPSSVSYFIVE